MYQSLRPNLLLSFSPPSLYLALKDIFYWCYRIRLRRPKSTTPSLYRKKNEGEAGKGGARNKERARDHGVTDRRVETAFITARGEAFRFIRGGAGQGQQRAGSLLVLVARVKARRGRGQGSHGICLGWPPHMQFWLRAVTPQVFN